MDEKELKTSTKQRVIIGIIAILMLGSVIAGYAAIILNGKNGSSSTSTEPKVDQAKIAEYEEAYNKVKAEFSEVTKEDFNDFIAYKSAIKAYNESAANSGGIQVNDLKEGSGKEIKDNDTEYLAYYVGWCADESIFDSSFDNNDDPKAFARILDPSLGMIEGWNLGVDGMKTGGIREVTISSELAYGDSREICGGTNKPLKFLIYAKDKNDNLKSLSDKLDEAYTRLQYAYYGIDYDSAGSHE